VVNAGKNATPVVKLQVPYFEKAPFSISDVTKETLHEEELAERAGKTKNSSLRSSVLNFRYIY